MKFWFKDFDVNLFRSTYGRVKKMLTILTNFGLRYNYIFIMNSLDVYILFKII